MNDILIVDDDVTLRAVLADFLSSYGYACTEAETVPQARKHLEEKRFDLAISDFDLPAETGIDLLKHVVYNYPLLNFIMITGSTDPEVKRTAFELGALEFMTKPFKLQDLLKKVKNLTPMERTLSWPPREDGEKKKWMLKKGERK